MVVRGMSMTIREVQELIKQTWPARPQREVRNVPFDSGPVAVAVMLAVAGAKQPSPPPDTLAFAIADVPTQLTRPARQHGRDRNNRTDSSAGSGTPRLRPLVNDPVHPIAPCGTRS